MKRELIERARQQRREPRRSDAVLWAWLRGRGAGPRFYRQKPIGRYLADFASERPRLVVAVEGQADARRRGAELERVRYFERRGYRVLRLGAAEVVRDPCAAFDRIRAAVERPVRAPCATSPPGRALPSAGAAPS